MVTTNPRQTREPRATIHSSAIVAIVANLDEQLHELRGEIADLKTWLKQTVAALAQASAKPQASTRLERQAPDGQVFLTKRQLQRRYGDVSHMWIERRLADDPLFPKPTVFDRIRYWRLDQLVAWESKQATVPGSPSVVRNAAARRQEVADAST